MQIKEVPASAFQSEPKQMRLHKMSHGWWNWRTDHETSISTPPQSYTVDLVFEPRLDMTGFPCYVAYDAQSDTLYVCYPEVWGE